MGDYIFLVPGTIWSPTETLRVLRAGPWGAAFLAVYWGLLLTILAFFVYQLSVGQQKAVRQQAIDQRRERRTGQLHRRIRNRIKTKRAE